MFTRLKNAPAISDPDDEDTQRNWRQEAETWYSDLTYILDEKQLEIPDHSEGELQCQQIIRKMVDKLALQPQDYLGVCERLGIEPQLPQLRNTPVTTILNPMQVTAFLSSSITITCTPFKTYFRGGSQLTTIKFGAGGALNAAGSRPIDELISNLPGNDHPNFANLQKTLNGIKNIFSPNSGTQSMNYHKRSCRFFFLEV
ncbi:hypothetical protein HYALB_00013422 [Hymenoscyphus albidus]|uniref:Uncharacterized protein n=1 Tax=Hymenoscyphus albidus TaxID=595503 RepID=A0A9N9LWA7_9HELO|nr:hypothetical protein HYALB_00013422 [Hymenoscyphus albidus]